MSTEKKKSHFPWEVSYNSIDSKRLWPEDTTIKGLDFKPWHKNKVKKV